MRYQYDPHLDPQLVWASKAERTSFEVDTVSLHIHERISTQAILKAVQREPAQRSLFADPELPLTKAVRFYEHEVGWANRLVLGDSLLVMNSLLHREAMAGKVQMIYMDPPYGVAYNSNFQPRVDSREVRHAKDDSLTREPEQLRAYRDTWTLGIHSYLTYLRDRLLLARELLSVTGALALQIGAEAAHHARALLAEIFGSENEVAQVVFAKTSGSTGDYLATTCDYLLIFARDKPRLKYRQLYVDKTGGSGDGPYSWVELPNGTRRRMSPEERSDRSVLPRNAKVFRFDNLQSQSIGREKGEGASCWFPVKHDGKEWRPSTRNRWKTNEEGMRRLSAAKRLISTDTGLYYVRYLVDFPVQPVTDLWDDTVIAGFASDKRYVVETSTKVVQRCLLMLTDPGDIVLDPTCGSGTTAYVAEQWGRRWITCDTSRVAIALARQRLMTATFPYYKLDFEKQGWPAASSTRRYRTSRSGPSHRTCRRSPRSFTTGPRT
ncbi:MAG: site-specific DNA-methyltransferase [Acidobacteriota bacterium]